MRVPALLAMALLVAGCTQNDPGSGPGGDDFTSCPSWVKLPHNGQVIDGALMVNRDTVVPDFERWDFMEPNATRAGQGIGDGHLREFDGHPLDQIVLDFHMRPKQGTQPARVLYVEDAELTLRFYRSDNGYPAEPIAAWDQALGAASAKEEWVFTSDPEDRYAIYNVTLRMDLAQPDQQPDPTGVFLHWQMTQHDLDGDIDTPSAAIMRYAPEFWYRTCSSDGTKH